jgi:ketosteroid isomerase-like protein
VSERDIDVVRDVFAAVNERDFARARAGHADDVVLVIREGFLNQGTFEGHQGLIEWFGDWFRAFGSDYRFEIVEARELSEGLVFLNATHGGVGRSSGAEVRGENAYLYRVEGGKITRVQLFENETDALEAAVLPEWSGGQTD